MRYRKRPYEVDAVQFTGDNTCEIRALLGPGNFWHTEDKLHLAPEDGYTDQIILRPGDWLVKGELYCYPVDAEYFDILYEVCE